MHAQAPGASTFRETLDTVFAGPAYRWGEEPVPLRILRDWWQRLGDWLVGLTRSFGPIDAELHYTDTVSYGEALAENLDDADKADGRLALQLTWGF